MKKIVICIAVIAVGTVLFLNGFLLMLSGSRNIGVYLTALLGLCVMAPAIFIKATKIVMSRNISKFLMIVISFFVIVVSVALSVIYFCGTVKTVTYKEDYILVLGCGLEGETPSAQLASRLDTALEYCEKNTTCKLIVSGGQGNGETITEAEAMRRYLVAHGIENDRIIKEDKSTSTTENFALSNSVIDGGLNAYDMAFITSDFHIYRADSIASYQGFQMNYIGASTPWYDIVPSYLREMLAIVQMFVFNK